MRKYHNDHHGHIDIKMMNVKTPITIFGASGTIGKKLSERLADYSPWTPSREEVDQFTDRKMGTVFYCIGKTVNFREDTQETIDTHVNLLNRILNHGQFNKLIYCSSTRVFDNLEWNVASEGAMLSISPKDPHYLYQLSKLLGEWLCLNDPKKRAVVVRMSNIYGTPGCGVGFLPCLLSELANGATSLSLSALANGQRDYLFIDDLIDMLLLVAQSNQHDLYNLASGESIHNLALFDFLRKKTACEFLLNLDDQPIHTPTIEIDRFVEEYQYRPPSFWQRLEEVLDKMGLLTHAD